MTTNFDPEAARKLADHSERVSQSPTPYSVGTLREELAQSAIILRAALDAYNRLHARVGELEKDNKFLRRGELVIERDHALTELQPQNDGGNVMTRFSHAHYRAVGLMPTPDKTMDDVSKLVAEARARAHVDSSCPEVIDALADALESVVKERDALREALRDAMATAQLAANTVHDEPAPIDRTATDSRFQAIVAICGGALAAQSKP